MNQLETNKKFADFIRAKKINGEHEILFEGKNYYLVNPQFGEFILLELTFDGTGWATSNKCVAYVNFNDTHG